MPDPTDPPKPQRPRTERRQVNVRLPTDLVQRMDARRARKDLSRDVWIERAVEFALAFNPENGSGALETTAGRTAPPPHRRTR